MSDQEYGLPYSKGLTASSIMATGLAPARAFHVAEVVEQRLHALGRDSVSSAELNALVREVLAAEVGERYAEVFSKWHLVKGLQRPLIVLVGGATGVGKSTIATMLASRLGMTRVIPTDAIREVMRSMFSTDLLPTLQRSSFEADQRIRFPFPPDTDPLIAGFREQVSAVVVGVEALIARAAEEGTHLIIEGAHLVPGFLDLSSLAERAVVVHVLVTVDDEEQHRSHLALRGQDSVLRPGERYFDHFINIRRLHKYLKSMALQHGVPLVPSYNLDATLSHVIDLVVNEAFQAVPA
ncbi:MAG: 2-phosphoglycerate kinase [Actinomycetota bacterium]